MALLPSPAVAAQPASIDIPPDDPIHQDLLRLALRYGDLSPGLTTRPLTRLEAARLLARINARYGPATDGVDRARRARLAAELAPELAWIRGERPLGQVLFRPVARLRCEGMIATGGDPYVLHGGDAAGPFAGCSATAELVAGPLAVVLEPRLAYDPIGGGNAPAGPAALGGGVVLDMPRGYAKLAGGNLELAGGVGDLAWGPGRGGMIWSGNAAPPLMLRFTQPRPWRLPWIFRYLGEFRFTGLWAHLLGPRTDVARPNLLGMKVDYRPIPWLEASFARLSMYGGEGRPQTTAGDIWRLLWAVDTHVDDDAAKEAFDANDIASLDISFTVPFAHRIPGVQFLQLYWSNAGEDTMQTSLGSLPLPALTGAANLGGAFLGIGPMTLRVEWVRLMDDRFRWYGTHRIYHEGFHHRGRVVGHPVDGDAEGTYVELGLDGGRWEAWLWLERMHHVGVVDVYQDKVYLLNADRYRTQVGCQLRVALPSRPRLHALVRFQVEHENNVDHVPGATATWPQLGIAVESVFH